MKTHKLPVELCLGVGLLASSVVGTAQTVLFSDDFATDTSANWTLLEASDDSPPDFTAEFAFDYSTQEFTRHGVTGTIPPSPNGGGTSRGLRLTVNNNDDIDSRSAVSLYPTGQSYSGDYALRFDLWLNYPGMGFGTAAGETEYATFGVNHAGDKINWISTGSNPVTDGAWFGLSSDGDGNPDYASYVGDGTGAAIPAGGALDRDSDGTPEDNATAALAETHPLRLMFPSPEFEAVGMPNKQWAQIEVRQRTNEFGQHMVTWVVNGYVMSEHPNGEALGQISGNIMIGLMDTFPSVANPKAASFAIFDNVRVVDLNGTPPTPRVGIVATIADAAEPATDGLVTISRTGDTTDPLTVNFRVLGTATRGEDYVTQTNGVTFTTGSVTIPGGSASVDVTIKVLDDGIGEAVETVLLVLDGHPEVYEVAEALSATVFIADDGDIPAATVVASKAFAYEPNAVNPGRFDVRFGNPTLSSVTVNYTISGTAVAGTDYAAVATSVTIPAGETNAPVHIAPIDNSAVDGDRTVILTLAAGDGYTITSPDSATVTIRDDDTLPAGEELFAEDFDSEGSGGNWMVNVTSDGAATFAYDYSVDGIPPAPNSGGTSTGLKLTGNESSGAFGGLSVSPIGQGFTGDYMLRFDMWINYPGPLPAGGPGSTEFAGGGVVTSGDVAEVAGSGNGLFFAATGDGDFAQDYRVYFRGGLRNIGADNVDFPGGSQNNTSPYYSIFGGEEAPASQAAVYPDNQTGLTASGNAGFAWRDMAIIKQGTLVSWYMDNLLIATYDLASELVSTNIALVYWDPNDSISPWPELTFGLFDNVRVIALAGPPAAPHITGIQIVSGDVQIDFTGAATDAAGDFTLLSSATVDGAYSAAAGASVSELGSGSFRATVPVSGAIQFYRIER